MTTRILTIANQKGGVGKTTTAVNLAYGLAQRNKHVLLVDLDPQGQCATFLGANQEAAIFSLLVQNLPPKNCVRQVRTSPDLWLLPGDKSTSNAAAILNVLQSPVDTLLKALAPLTKNGLNYIIIDTAPSVSNLQAMALFAAELILVPTACDFASVEGITALEETLLTLRTTYGWTGSIAGILPTFYDTTTSETTLIMQELNRLYPNSIIYPVHRATVLRELVPLGLAIQEHAPASRAAAEYTNLVQHILTLG